MATPVPFAFWNEQMELRTERLLLRPFQMSDAPAIAASLNNLNISRWLMTVPHPYDVSDAVVHLSKNVANQGSIFAVESQNSLVGCIGTRRELGYWISESHWGLGYATEAAQAVISHYFKEKENLTLLSGYCVGNHRSHSVLSKLGFAPDLDREAHCMATGLNPILKGMILHRSDWHT